MALILVVDDEPGIRRMVRRSLEASGHTVLEAEDGDAGAQLFRDHIPDVVLIDLFMPQKEGIQTIREMRRMRPEAKIIAMSGGGTFGLNLLDGLEYLGADRTLAKPFRNDELIEAIAQVQ